MIPRLVCLVALSALLLAGPAAEARFLKPELEKVPIEKLIKNLQEQARKETKNAAVRYNLARVHAMAYALKTDSCEAPKKRQLGDGPWFGFTPPVVPFKSVETDDAAKLEKAKVHLDKAITTYKELVADQPMHLPARLGLAWCIEQSGAKEDAIKAYREVVDEGWDKERKLKSGPLGGNFITKEAAGYLLPLLDAKKDIDEIESLKQRVALLNKLPRPITPIAIPLKDGLSVRDLEDRGASVLFDADGTGPRRWSWITKDAGWLVYLPPSPAGRGVGGEGNKVTSGLQLFGNVTFWCFWDNGYEALRCLDDNGDGVLTGNELNNLAIWHDANGNGICEEGEVRPLSYHGITGLACAWQTDAQHPDRIAFSPRGVRFQSGTTRPTYDLVLQPR